DDVSIAQLVRLAQADPALAGRLIKAANAPALGARRPTASLQEAMHEDYIAMARLRGLSEARVLLVHALKNASLPTISLIGVQAGFMFGGTVLVEVIFAYPGLGNLMVDAVRNQDLPVIQVVALIYCVLVLCLNALVDVLYLLVNPRLRAA
ncbi:MAG: ABC transporter permease subunit, partial [Elioraea tepidiphila]